MRELDRGIRAVRRLADHPQPATGGAGRDFANAVALVESRLDPPEMLGRLKAIEREFGRRPGKRWGPRVLDLDIVAVERRQVPLAAPHHPASAARSAQLRASAARRDRARLAHRTADVRHLAHALPAERRTGNRTRRWALSSVGRATDF